MLEPIVFHVIAGEIQFGKCLRDGVNATDSWHRKRTILTMLPRKPLARCCTPLWPIRLLRRFSLVSVFKWRNSYVIWDTSEENDTDPVPLQTLGQLFCSQDLNITKRKTETGECLQEKRDTGSIGEIWIGDDSRLTVLSLMAFARCCTPATPISLRSTCNLVSVYVKKDGRLAYKKY